MRRPPRPPAEPLFSWPLVFWSVLQGLLVFVLSGTIFVIASWRSMPADEARADFLLAGPIDRKPDPRQPILQHVPRHGDPTAKPDAGVDHHRGRRYSRTQPAGTSSAEPVQLRPAPLGRSQPDTRGCGNNPGRTRTHQDVLA